MTQLLRFLALCITGCAFATWATCEPMNGQLNVMALGPTGEREYHPVTTDGCGGGLNAAYRIDTIDIPNDGGDW